MRYRNAMGVCVVVLLAMGWANTAQAVTEENLKRYAEAVDYLDRWRGDRAKLDEAHERLTKLLIDEPDFAPAHVEMARWYLMNSHNNEAALRSLDQAQALDSEFPGTYVLRGYIFGEQNRLQEAHAELDRAAEIGTDNPWLALNRAAVFEKQGRDPEALPLYESVFEHDIDDPKAWPAAKVGLINLLARTGDMQAVEAVFLRAQVLKPNAPDQVANYAVWLASKSRFDEGIAILRGALQRGSSDVLSFSLFRLLLGRATLALSSDRDTARVDFDEATSLAQSFGAPIEVSFDVWAEQTMREAESQQ